jgi:hypothetical protein
MSCFRKLNFIFHGLGCINQGLIMPWRIHTLRRGRCVQAPSSQATKKRLERLKSEGIKETLKKIIGMENVTHPSLSISLSLFFLHAHTLSFSLCLSLFSS